MTIVIKRVKRGEEEFFRCVFPGCALEEIIGSLVAATPFQDENDGMKI